MPRIMPARRRKAILIRDGIRLAHEIDRLFPPEQGYPTRKEIADRIEIAVTRELLEAAQAKVSSG